MAKKKYASKNGNCLTALMYMFIGSVSLVLVIATIALTIAGILAVSTGALIIIALLIGIGVIYILFKIIKFIMVKAKLIISSSKIHNPQENVEEFVYFATESPLIPQSSNTYPDDFDILFEEAGRYVIENKQVSIGMLQRTFKIGFNRASRIMDQLSATDVIVLDLRLETGKARMSLKDFETFIISPDYLNHISAPSENYEPSSEGLHKLNLYNDKFDYMSGNDFEYYCAELLKKSGFMKVQVTSASGDYGADILAEQHGIKYAIQCKCYSSDIGIDAVYQISGGMKYYEANVGCVLTNRYFTRQARELADKIGIILWNRDFLIELVQNSTQN